MWKAIEFVRHRWFGGLFAALKERMSWHKYPASIKGLFAWIVVQVKGYVSQCTWLLSIKTLNSTSLRKRLISATKSETEWSENIIGDGLAFQILSSGGVFSRRSYILAGDIRIAVEWGEFDDDFDLPEASSSTQFRYSLGSRSLGYLHRRNHHVQVRILISQLISPFLIRSSPSISLPYFRDWSGICRGISLVIFRARCFQLTSLWLVLAALFRLPLLAICIHGSHLLRWRSIS